MVEVTETSFKERLGGSMGLACCGVLFFGGSFYLLGENERRAVDTAETIDDARKAVVQTSTCTPDPNNNGQLVSMVSCTLHPGLFPGQTVAGRVPDSVMISGLPGGSEHITTLGYTGDDVLSWNRHAEQYQYKETSHSTTTKTSTGGKKTVTTYSYSKAWSGTHETWRCSSGCQDKCRSDLGSGEPCTITTWNSGYAATTTGQVDKVYLTDSISNGTNYTLWIGGNNWGNGKIPDIGSSRDLSIHLTNPSSGFAACDSNHLKYSPGSLSNDCGQHIGDWRWHWQYRTVPADGLSVLAQQVKSGDGYTFIEWSTGKSVSWMATNSIGRVQEGACDGDCMLDDMEDENKVTTWILRFVGWLVMWCGIAMMVHPIAVAPAFIPIIGNFLEGFIGKILAIFSCLCAMGLSTLTIGLAWLAFRPKIAIPLLITCCCCTAGAAFVGYTAYNKNKKRKTYDPQRDDAVYHTHTEPSAASLDIKPSAPPPGPPGGFGQVNDPET